MGGARLVPGLEIRAGQTLAGKYRVEELIGSGGSGIVLSAHHIWLREPVTLKIFASYTDGQEELLQRRLTKARLAARLRSRHVARIVDIGLTGEAMPYVATECIKGKTLAVELEERGRLEVTEAVRWVLEACEALAEAHSLGLRHGDLKPQNVMLAETDDGDRIVKVLDFGSTSPLDAIGDQSTSAFYGSPAFLAPEQIRDPESADARADVWALGALLYNLVSGAPPFSADTVSGVMVAVVYDVPGLLVDAPYELARLVQRCLEKDPANRPQTVTVLATALAPFAGSEGARLSERVRVMSEAPPPPEAPRSWLAGLVDAVSSSAPPVSMTTGGGDDRDSDVPLPLVTKRAPAKENPAAQRTLPSKRVAGLRRRRSRVRTAAFGMLGAAAAIVLATTVSKRPSTPSVPTMVSLAQEGLEDSAESARAALRAGVGEPTTTTAAELETGKRDEAKAPAPHAPISFAPTPDQPMTATPLAATPTPLAVAESEPAGARPGAPAAVAPPAAPPLPAPASRQFLSGVDKADKNPRIAPLPFPRGAPPPRSAPPKSHAEEVALRKLFDERK